MLSEDQVEQISDIIKSAEVTEADAAQVIGAVAKATGLDRMKIAQILVDSGEMPATVAETQPLKPEDIEKARGRGKLHGDPILIIE